MQEGGEPRGEAGAWGGRVCEADAPAPAGLLVDRSRTYSTAFYSCAAGTLAAAVCLALVRPCKRGLCRRPRAREGAAEGPRGKALQDIPEDFLEMDLGKTEHRAPVGTEPV